MSPNRISNLDFIARARTIHGERYDYSQIDYRNARQKIEVVCEEHGPFLTLPSNFIRGRGCPACAGLKRMTTEGFIERAQEIHGTRYDYSKVDYVNARSKVLIICVTHGEFNQIPFHHLSGSGCPACGYARKASRFIVKARGIHGNKYDYSKTLYKGMKSRLSVICPKHGRFDQSAQRHLSGSGCPWCAGKNAV